jgi:hypothetical protein
MISMSAVRTRPYSNDAIAVLNAATAADVCRAAARTPDIAVAAWTVIIVYLVFEGMNVVGWLVGCSVCFGIVKLENFVDFTDTFANMSTRAVENISTSPRQDDES